MALAKSCIIVSLYSHNLSLYIETNSDCLVKQTYKRPNNLRPMKTALDSRQRQLRVLHHAIQIFLIVPSVNYKSISIRMFKDSKGLSSGLQQDFPMQSQTSLLIILNISINNLFDMQQPGAAYNSGCLKILKHQEHILLKV